MEGFYMANHKTNRKAFGIALMLIMIGILLTGTQVQAKRNVEKRNGLVTTVEIDALGEITDTVIDTLEFDAANGEYPNIIQVSENVYAITYTQVLLG